MTNRKIRKLTDNYVKKVIKKRDAIDWKKIISKVVTIEEPKWIKIEAVFEDITTEI